MAGRFNHCYLQIPAPSVKIPRKYNESVPSRISKFEIKMCRAAGGDEKHLKVLLQSINICWRKIVQMATEQLLIAV